MVKSYGKTEWCLVVYGEILLRNVKRMRKRTCRKNKWIKDGAVSERLVNSPS